MEMKTPYYVIHKDELDRNISEFTNALKEVWPNSQLAYSVKTNSLPWLLKYLCSRDIFAEVVSDEEYELAKICGYKPNQIIFNGPIKGDELFRFAINSGSIVNMDSKNDLVLFMREDTHPNGNVGLRINPNPKIFDTEDIGYVEDGFRFGFSDDNVELHNALSQLKKKDVSTGLHLHCNSVTRAKEVYIAIARYAASIIKKYSLDVSYIDIGGGFFGGVPGKTTPLEYMVAIANELEGVVDKNKTRLYIEPGSAIVGSVVDLVTSVIDVKDTSNARIVTTDGSRIHIDPLWIKKNYMYSIQSENNTIKDKQIICGYTCMDHDRLMKLERQKELSIGDRIVYHRVGAYSMTFGGMFIRYHPDVYINDGTMKIVRKRISTEDYYRIHNFEENLK